MPKAQTVAMANTARYEHDPDRRCIYCLSTSWCACWSRPWGATNAASVARRTPATPGRSAITSVSGASRVRTMSRCCHQCAPI